MIKLDREYCPLRFYMPTINLRKSHNNQSYLFINNTSGFITRFSKRNPSVEGQVLCSQFSQLVVAYLS